MTARRCPRCQRNVTTPDCCGVLLTVRRRRWRMSNDKKKLVHILKARKGLDEETYRLRLGAVGVKSCTELGRDQFHTFLKGLAALPDRPGWVDHSSRRDRG